MGGTRGAESIINILVGFTDETKFVIIWTSGNFETRNPDAGTAVVCVFASKAELTG